MESIPFSKDPLLKQVTDYCKQVTSTKAEYEAQIEAYKVLCDKYAAEKDKRRRQTMQNLLDFVMDPEGWEMKPTYAFTECLDEALRYEKAAQKSLYPIPLYDMITHAVTHATFTIGRGESTRWTVYGGMPSYSNADASKRKRYDDWTAGEISGAYVKFGSHHFSIGKTADYILKALEERYGLDFKELEKQRKSRKSGNGSKG